MSAAAVPPHPRMPVWLRPLTRRPGEVQFGVLPGGPVVTGISRRRGRAARPSRRRPARSRRPSGWRPRQAIASRRGGGRCSSSSTDLGRAHRPVTPAPVRGVERPTRRTPPGRVVVDGCGDVASDIAEALAQAGTTVVHGRGRGRPGRRRHRCDHDPTSWSSSGHPSSTRAVATSGCGTACPHLPVAPAGPRTVVGPLVDGSPGAPCLWCLDRHRADRDDAWPTVMSQAAPGRTLALAGPPEGRHDALAPGLAHLVVGTVTLLVIGRPRGPPAPARGLGRGEPPVAADGPPALAAPPALPEHPARTATSGPGGASGLAVPAVMRR